MFLAKQPIQRCPPAIGRRFGNRDHTTVMQADLAFAADVQLLRRMLET